MVAGGARVQAQANDLVTGQGAAERADCVLAVEVTRWLRLGDRVIARPQTAELVVAVGSGRCRKVDRAEVIGAGQRDGHTWDARLARLLDAVVVHVQVNKAGYARRRDFRKIVMRKLVATERDDNCMLADAVRD